MIKYKNSPTKHFISRKTRIHLTEEQKNVCLQQAGMFRYVYNWGIEKEMKQYELSQSDPSQPSFLHFNELAKLYSEEKNSREDMAFLRESKIFTVGIARMALKDVVSAYIAFFESHNGHPKFKSKKTAPVVIKYRKEKTYIVNGKVRLEGFKSGEMVDLDTSIFDDIGFYPGHQIPREVSEWVTPRVSFNKDFWSLDFQCPMEPDYIQSEKTEAIGVDLNVRPTFAISTHETFQQPNTDKYVKKIKRISRKMDKAYKRRLNKSRMLRTKISDIPKTKNELKLESKYRKYHRRISNIKNNFYCNTVKEIVSRNPECVCIEKFRVTDICKQYPYMWKHMANTSFYKISRIFKANCEKHRVPLIVADPQYPSSKLCSNCGFRINKFSRWKTFKCPNCGMIKDRDLNAAENLKSLWDNRYSDKSEYKHELYVN